MNDRFTLGRVLSEGAIIVGSILLAFAIDAGWDAHRERAAELEAMSDDAVRAIPTEQVEEYERAMGQWMTFEPRVGVLSSLVGDGQLGLIRDDSLRDALVEWLQRIDDSAEEAGMVVRTSERIALRWNHGELQRLAARGEKVLAEIRANRD